MIRLLGDLAKMRHKLKAMLQAFSVAFSRIEKIYIFSSIGVFLAGWVVVLLVAGPDVGDIGNGSGESAAVEKPANQEDRFTYELPLIVVQMPNQANLLRPKSLVVNGSLQFKGKSSKQLTRSIRMAKLLTPSIMDAIMAGIRREGPDKASNPVVVNRIVLDRSNEVLRPYGVAAERMVLGDVEVR